MATISSNSPTFTRGGSIEFFGATERIYIGHDIGVTRIDFDGANETFIGAAGSYTANVPRPLQTFLGNLYFGNGSNIGEINSSATLTTYAKLSPGFPSNTQVRDIDTSPDGSYMEFVVSELALSSILSATPDPSEITHANSFIFKWNGIDTGYTSFNVFTGYALTANHIFGQQNYTFGYDLPGGAVFNPLDKFLSPVFARSPMPNGISSTGNVIGWHVPEFDSGFLKHSIFLYGALDQDFTPSWYRQLRYAAQGSDLNVIRVPFALLVSNLAFGASTNSYTGGTFGHGKMYFSVIETDASNTLHYKFYKWFNVVTGTGTTCSGVYETQTQLFSKKVKPSEVRVYTEPLTTNNAFTVALIGSDGSVISNSSQTFTVGSNVTSGADLVQYNPACAPTYAIGVRITNSGSANWVGNKVEIDYEQSGK